MATREVVMFGMMIGTDELNRILATVGQRIAKLRRGRGFSQEHLAEVAGISRDHIAKIEVALKAPSLGTAINIARALDVELSDLFADEKAELVGVARELADMLQTLTASEAQFVLMLVRETTGYLEQHRGSALSTNAKH